MKIKISMFFEVLKYWLINGKTMTALLIAVATIALRELEMEQYAPDVKELIIALTAAGGLSIVGIWHKIKKFIASQQ